MAELKLILRTTSSGSMLFIHGGNAVAELKLGAVECVHSADDIIHGGNAVAELKQAS